MKVLVTGSFGNIGEKVVNALLKKGYQPICFDLDNENNQKVAKKFRSQIETVWGDITNAEQVKKVVSEADAIIHMAAMLPATVDLNPELGEKVNVGGTKNIIDAILACDAQPHLIFCSSVSVHGFNTPDSPHPHTIDTPFKADDNYAGHKIQCENLIDESGLNNATVVRIGACMDADSDIGGDPRESLKLLFKTHPDCRLEYVHPKDVALALANAVNNDEAKGHKFFLGGGEEAQATWRDFSGIAFSALGIPAPPRELFGDEPYYTEYMDTKEAERVLHFQNYTLKDYQKEMQDKFALARLAVKPVKFAVKRFMYSYSPNK